MTEFPDPWRELGSFIREQRAGARLSLRRLSDLTGISNPYLSQIERGLRRPSAEILQQIAKALRISAETLYVRAGMLEARRIEGDLAEAILAESSLTLEQRQTLLRIFLSFRRENEAHGGPAAPAAPRPDGTDGGAHDRAGGGAKEGAAGGVDERAGSGAKEGAGEGAAGGVNEARPAGVIS